MYCELFSNLRTKNYSAAFFIHVYSHKLFQPKNIGVSF